MSKRERIAILLASVLLVPVTSTQDAAAQSTHPAADTTQPVQLIPGLDKRLIDTEADPCVDFAAYACGNFDKLYPIPPDESDYDSWAIVWDYTQRVLDALLDEAAVASPTRTANEQKIGDYYATCMDTDAIHAGGLKPLQPDLDRIAALTDKKQLTDLLVHYQLININAFFTFGEQQDFKDARKQIAVVDQGGLGLPERDYYFRTGAAAEKTREQYVQHVMNMLKLMGEPDAQAAGDAQKIMQLETALAKVSMDVTSRRDPENVYHPMTAVQLAGLTPEIEWTAFFANTGAPPVTDLNVANPDFFKGLQSLLDIDRSRNHQDLSALATDRLNTELGLAQGNGRRAFQLLRYASCAASRSSGRAGSAASQATDGALGEALGQVYVDQQFPACEQSRHAADGPRHRERRWTRRSTRSTWMSPQTKADGQGQAAPGRRQDRLSRPLARLLDADSRPRRRGRQCHARRRVRESAASWPRSASRSIAASGA